MYFESHAHLDDKRFREDREELLGLLPSFGIDYVVNVGCDVKSSKQSIRLAERYDYIFASVGIHPHELYDMSSQTIEELRRLSQHKKVVAIGEIGLDYYYDTHPRELQQFWFRQQLRLAESVNKPVIIHSRDASQETFDIMSASNVRKGVIHCYSGSAPMAVEYTKMGFYIGIGGVVTFPNAKKMVEVVDAIPLEKILIETDSPYLAPAPNRGKRNDPRNLEYIVTKIAEIKNISPENVANITSKNAQNLFF
ncbi:TatD family hydrolase [Anaerotignum propionicum]|uniref:Deoxyribonuclease YcfH n=1 Tax=Anaerotignum propionicum DSM 1682 TaxID=991789 RepID=A0A110A6P1_ANAPI|nr:TatD family hydrolase [Anaerotignum propionicum]AMJ39865.1 putative deoxyribonuclease YcfH [Anaerotignum propionicum DSM 1682]SHE27734.1 TatD DNase family protein [[Clostridium] propionicum DSM 1682] [Anaerotignum propionicum DSM 1682]